MIAAQLAATPAASGEPCAAATALTAAGLAAGEALRWLDGAAPLTQGASLEVTTTGELRRRSWPPHPDCHCLSSRASGPDSSRRSSPDSSRASSPDTGRASSRASNRRSSRLSARDRPGAQAQSSGE